jgi:uncharacterized protein with ParB-like and HNH nuclease domain
MKIELHNIPIRELVKGYKDCDEEGVTGYSGRLNIRPKYQREFVYKDKQREAVIESVMNKHPLNVMYWVKNSNSDFEVLDGQQRIISVCQYYMGEFDLAYKKFENLSLEKQKAFLDYEIMVYFCEGNEDEKLNWFEIINIAGVKLTDQELLNAVYSGD